MTAFERWFDELVRQSMEAFAAEVAVDVRLTIDKACPAYHTGTGGHSHVGSPPYKETGDLQKSVASGARVIATGNVEGRVSAATSYAPRVEQSRPFLKPAAVRAANTIAARLSAHLIARLP